MSWLAHNRNLLALSAQSTRAAQLMHSALLTFGALQSPTPRLSMPSQAYERPSFAKTVVNFDYNHCPQAMRRCIPDRAFWGMPCFAGLKSAIQHSCFICILAGPLCAVMLNLSVHVACKAS